MSVEPISDKALIKVYLKKKGISRLSFCRRVGLSRSFLDVDATITVDNLRKILDHPDCEDFNLEAFLGRSAHQIVKERGQLSEGMANQDFIIEAMVKLNKLKSSPYRANDSDTKHVLVLLERAIDKISCLSKDYHVLFREYQKLHAVADRSSVGK